jgi:uncharacterized membrane protein YfbV (UPF0208 family)
VLWHWKKKYDQYQPIIKIRKRNLNIDEALRFLIHVLKFGEKYMKLWEKELKVKIFFIFKKLILINFFNVFK